MSEINVLPSVFIGPKVSKARGTNKYLLAISAYLPRFLSAALSAAAPGVFIVMFIYEGASVSVAVTSHVKYLPCDHGMSVMPSRRLPSERERPAGSLVAGVLACVRARQMISLSW